MVQPRLLVPALRLPALLALLLHHMQLVEAFAFSPDDPADFLWDTWIRRRPEGGWLLNYLVKHHTPRWEAWNAISSASSVDGAHFADLGVSLQQRCDCCNASCARDNWAQLGSSSVWPRLGTNRTEWLMAVGSTPAAPPGAANCDPNAPGCHGIYFHRSTDLVSWEPFGKMGAQGTPVFRPNASLYVNKGGDCIAALPRPGGGYYGYFSALPMPRGDVCGTLPANCTACFSGRPANTSQCSGLTPYFGGRACNICGAGFAESDDGLTWNALPTPGPAVGPSLRSEPWGSHSAEVGGLCQLGNRTYMTFDAGHLYEATSPRGPFTPAKKNFNFLTQETGSVFARLWGEIYTGDKDLALVTHQQLSANNYAGLVKRAVLGPDGVLRAQWWSANDVLRSSALEITNASTNASAGAGLVTECTGDCMSSGIWLEGNLAAAGNASCGVMLESSAGDVFFAVDGAGRFVLDGLPPMRHDHDVWTSGRLVIDRAMPPRATRSFRLLARNSKAGEGLVEFYVDEMLSLPVTIKKGRLSGGFSVVGAGAQVSSAHRLSLSLPQVALKTDETGVPSLRELAPQNKLIGASMRTS